MVAEASSQLFLTLDGLQHLHILDTRAGDASQMRTIDLRALLPALTFSTPFAVVEHPHSKQPVLLLRECRDSRVLVHVVTAQGVYLGELPGAAVHQWFTCDPKDAFTVWDSSE